MQDLKTENILKVVYNDPTTKEEKELALKEYVDLIWKINDLTKEVKELSIPRVSKSLTADELINYLGEPSMDNEYVVRPDQNGKWWIEHKHVGSGEPLK